MDDEPGASSVLASVEMRVTSRSAFALVAALPVFVAVTSCELAVKLDDLEGGCPPLRGAAQVKVTSAGGSYCIDSTEATNAQYAQFLASGFVLAPSLVPAGCEAVTDETPSNDWPTPPGFEQFPVVNVNFCQATAYCRWSGKRMCGSIGGGALAAVSFKDPTMSQWLNACTKGGAQTYPYGNTFDATACSNAMLSRVDSFPGCVGAYPGVSDMSGNVWEWTDTCASSDPTAFCDALGGAFDSQTSELTCVSERNWTRTSGAGNIGIRCCLDL
jgi:sulfatase modifying factor 1